MNSTTSVSAQLETAVSEIPGWTALDQLMALYTLAYATSETTGDILELGSWCGRSATALAMAARTCGKGKVHCVDLFPTRDDWYQNRDGSWSCRVSVDGHVLGAYSEQTVWAEPFERDIAPAYARFPGGTWQAFQMAMERNALTPWVEPFKGDLGQFAASATSQGLKLRLAFIDGDHSYTAVARDISHIERFMTPGGWICFDDAFSTYEGVNEAIRTHIIDSPRYELGQQLTRKFFAARFLG